MTLSKVTGAILLLIFTPLYVLAFLYWALNTVFYKEQWECINCRKDDDPSIKQQFLYFTVWNMYFSIAIFFSWAAKKLFQYRNDFSYEKIHQHVFNISLPHIITVGITYIYYNATNDTDGYANTDVCYSSGKTILSRQITSNEGLANIILVIGVMSDLTVHYFSAPLMILLLLTDEMKYDVSLWRPYSTLFVFVLGMIVALGQTFGSRIYCGDAWFNTGSSIGVNFAVHCILVCYNHWRLKYVRASSHEDLNVGDVQMETLVDYDTDSLEA